MTSSFVYPTNTEVVRGEAHCFDPDNGDYEQFGRKDSINVAKNFCSNDPILEADGDTIPDHYKNDLGVSTHIVVRWATDQSNCAAKGTYHFAASEDFPCERLFDINYFCDVSAALSYGGGYVLNTPSSGCIEINLWATIPGANDRLDIRRS
ncbi:hypothetical protein WHR41_04872 [Cladosporium halotolerans]|uniref:Uncharacterized protein n=1 Tax=Cladosporium halotolerans TaxID=1052096 RepID=A0AB34KN14_9PEZI